ncbi:elongation factor P hydroxylase [Psychrobacter sp. 16-MNA-CIBAN-0192]|uniref:elongation factor P hydroxylase n=1 Tax=Psychrobacter sp. 16-MNA-CIBAN-0192 TaxID=3140448 RepID=UPI00331B2459
MITSLTQSNFANLLSTIERKNLFSYLEKRQSKKSNLTDGSINVETDAQLRKLSLQWQYLVNQQPTHLSKELVKKCGSVKQNLAEVAIHGNSSVKDSEQAMTDWLIILFNHLFNHKQVILVRGTCEPEYFPAQNNQPARIEFAHGFFASALHEISHFCVAGPQRRLLPDFGYWYAADGRSAAQQQAFERVEIKPQALECLFTLVCGRLFQVSQDNLFADFDTSASTFAQDVYQQAQTYLAKPDTLPPDAKTLLHGLLKVCKTS